MVEIKKTVPRIKKTFRGLISRLNMAEETISDLKYRFTETSQTEMKEWKKKKKRQNIQELWDNIKKCYTYTVDS